MARSAQDAAFWSTTVALSKSKGEVEAVLEKFGAEEYGSYFVNRQDEKVLLVEFIYSSRRYRFEYRPIAPSEPTWRWSQNEAERAAKMTALREQALRQMGRIAVNHCKVLLQLIDSGHEELLLPYLVLPGDTTLQRVGPDNFMPMLQAAQAGLLALPAPPDSPEFEEVKLNG